MRAFPTAVFAALSSLVLGAAFPGQADAAAITFTLDNVAFADGGSASGLFSLNVINFLSLPTGLATTTGGSFTGISYDPIFAFNQGTPPSTGFDFNSTNFVFVLHLETAQPLSTTSSGPIALLPGGGTPGAYTGSYEECVSSPITCGLPFEAARFVVSGDLLVPEPASVTILGIAAAALLAARRLVSRRSASSPRDRS